MCLFFAFQQVELVKTKDGPLGLRIMGGSDKPTHVFRQGDKPGIFIREVTIIHTKAYIHTCPMLLVYPRYSETHCICNWGVV